MQSKTVKKIIIRKLEHWLKSIEDKELRIDVRNNILLTGGAIANLLCDEDVNDYDLYLMDMDVLKRLCEYYIKKVKVPVEILDGRLHKEYMEIIAEREGKYKKYSETTTEEDERSEEEIEFDKKERVDFAKKSVAMRTIKPDQIKIFSHSITIYSQPKSKKKPKKYTVAFITSNAISLNGDVQIITRFCGDPEHIHDTFDFVHATNYFTFKDGLVTNQEALLSIMAKQLYYRGSKYPLSSLVRVRKFLKRGWDITAGEMLKMMYQINELNLDDIDTLEEQLVGVDVAYFSSLIDVLREGEKEGQSIKGTIIDAIDKVFNSYEYDISDDDEEDEEEENQL